MAPQPRRSGSSVFGVDMADGHPRDTPRVCLADGPKAGLKIEPFEPPADVVCKVEQIVAAAKIDVGGVEYIIDERDGRLLFYDINALSNFVADAPRILGFDPHARLVDYLEQERDA